MPAGLIEQKHGVRTRFDGPGDLGQMQAHRLGGAAGHDEAGTRSPGRADRGEEVGGGCALVLGSRRACATTCPAAGDRVLLADARFVAEPDLYRLAANDLRNLRQAGGEIFLKTGIAS